MPAGPRYTPAEDARIAKAVEAGARTEADFRALAREIGRPALTLRHRAIKLDLIQPIRRGARAPEAEPKTKRGTAFSAEEDAFLLRARERGMTLREIGFALDRSWSGIENRLLQLGARQPVARSYAVEVKPNAAAQAQACERHAAACLAAGGFWSFSERRIGRGKWAVCLPLVPPVQMQGAPR